MSKYTNPGVYVTFNDITTGFPKYTYNTSTGNAKYGYSTSTGDTTFIEYQYMPDENTWYKIDYPKVALKVENIARTRLVLETEEMIEAYILNDFDKYYIIEMGAYVYQVIQEKAYDIASIVVNNAKKDYDIQDEESIIEAIFNEINFDALYDLVDDIFYAPKTTEEKLAEIGMSYKDFL